MLWGEKWTEWDNLFSDNGSFPLLHDAKAHNELLHPQRGYYDIWDKHARTIRAQAQQAAAAGFQAFMFCAPLSNRYLIRVGIRASVRPNPNPNPILTLPCTPTPKPLINP